MIPRRLEDVSEADLIELCRSEVAEGRMLEYKRDLPADGREAKAEFLADVTSMANAQGGDIIFGIEEAKGVARRLARVDPPNLDEAIQRLDSLLRDKVDPRVTGARFQWVPLAGGGGALVLRVPPSFSGPHRNGFDNRFYGRNSRGKYPMDTHELRVAFTASEGLPGQLRDLHEEAFAKALPFRLFPGPQARLSIIPVASLRDVRDIEPSPERALAPVRPAGAMRSLHTLEGVILHTPPDPSLYPQYPEDFVRTFALTHRRGRMHVGWSIGGERELRKGEVSRLVFVDPFEQDFVGISRAAVSRLREAGFESPWAVIATIEGIEGYELLVTADDYSPPAWRDGARLPALMTEQADEAALTPLLKSVWLLFGMVRPTARRVPKGGSFSPP